jgi:hypothetical protein
MRKSFAGRAARTAVAVVTLVSLAPGAMLAQCLTRPESVTVVSGAHYDANWLHARILGENYRTVWTTPIRVPVLDLCTFAGGLTAIPRPDTVGGKQTLSIRFRGGNGREYVFRSVDKDPTLVLPPPLRRTVVRHIVRDMTSIGHPVGALVVAPMLRASGVLHAEPTLVVLPDDARLGSYRERFKGMLGMIEERPNDEDEGGTSLPGVTDVVSTQSLVTRLDRSPSDRVDARAFLAARLVDLFLGDWDRHQDQWRWGRVAKGAPWLPIPRDRDMAFAKSEGILMPLARVRYPQFVDFSNEYPSMVGLSWQGRVLDRRLLSSLERSAWDSVVADLRARLTDAVIDDAVARLPREYHAIQGTWLAATLRARRDLLPSAADQLYRQLAAEVDVHATDAAEEAEARVYEDGDVELTIRARGTAAANGAEEPQFRRRFDRADTREVRLYLRGGDDRVVARGARASDIELRLDGGPGADEYVDETPGCAANLHIYDADAATPTAGCTRIDRRPYVPTIDPSQTSDDSGPHRDWGTKLEPAPWLGSSPDVGAILGGGVTYYRYGFRHKPFASRQTIRAAFATGAQRFKGEYDAEFHPRNSGMRYDLFARASGIEIIRFHGLGNETRAEEPREHYQVEQEQYVLEPGVSFPLARHAMLTLGPTFKHARTDLGASPFLATLTPYGAERFSQLGARAAVTVDTRDRPGNPQRGVLLAARGLVYPEIWDVASTFSSAEGEASAYLRLGGPVLALRAGGKQVFGTYPFHEAAFLGGGATLRGWTEQRFAGDATLYGNAELRAYLTDVFFVLPGELGVFALADAGRVFLDGESSDAWHSALGGGLWVAFLDRANTISVAYAKSRERGGVDVSLGFMF